MNTVSTAYRLEDRLLVIYNCVDEYSNPRDFESTSIVWLWHRKCCLGDADEVCRGDDVLFKPKTEDFDGWESLKDYINKEYQPLAMTPVFMYDHSDIVLSSGKFSDTWDSGQVGFAFVAKSSLSDLGYKRSVPTAKQKAEKILQQELQDYFAYVEGACFTYKVYSLPDLKAEKLSQFSYTSENTVVYGYEEKRKLKSIVFGADADKATALTQKEINQLLG